MQEFKEKFLSLIHSEQKLRKYSLRFGVDYASLPPEACSLISNLIMAIAMMVDESIRGMNNQVIRMESSIRELKKPSLLSAKLCSAAVKTKTKLCDRPR